MDITFLDHGNVNAKRMAQVADEKHDNGLCDFRKPEATRTRIWATCVGTILTEAACGNKFAAAFCRLPGNLRRSLIDKEVETVSKVLQEMGYEIDSTNVSLVQKGFFPGQPDWEVAVRIYFDNVE